MTYGEDGHDNHVVFDPSSNDDCKFEIIAYNYKLPNWKLRLHLTQLIAIFKLNWTE